MEKNQIVAPDSAANRRPDGKFGPGNRANPHGQKGAEKWQPYGKRAQYLGEKYTIGELKALVKDKKKMDSLSFFDGVCIKHMVNTLVGNDIRQERKDMLDRIEGQPKQVIQEVFEEETEEAYGTIEDAASAYLNASKS